MDGWTHQQGTGIIELNLLLSSIYFVIRKFLSIFPLVWCMSFFLMANILFSYFYIEFLPVWWLNVCAKWFSRKRLILRMMSNLTFIVDVFEWLNVSLWQHTSKNISLSFKGPTSVKYYRIRHILVCAHTHTHKTLFHPLKPFVTGSRVQTLMELLFACCLPAEQKSQSWGSVKVFCQSCLFLQGHGQTFCLQASTQSSYRLFMRRKKEKREVRIVENWQPQMS